MNRQNKKENYKDFDALKLILASPEDILNWSHGEVTKAETINYRTQRPEPDGLFCEKIFGPSKNFECFCGKYKKIRYRGIVCDKCGVEVTTSDVRRERMGHIKLSVPVSHVWFAYGVPNKLSIILEMPHKQLLSVLYYTRYMIVSMDENARSVKLSQLEEYRTQEFNNIKEELENKLNEEKEKLETEVKELKKDKKIKSTEVDFKTEQLDHKRKQSEAKLRREFAEEEEKLQGFYNSIQTLLEKAVVGTIISEEEYINLSDRDLMFFEAKMGAEAVDTLLKALDVDAELSRLRTKVRTEKGEKKAETITRLQYLEGLKRNGIKPDWMIMNILPVIPPELRPIIPLSGGKFATSDLNDLYRRIINRNNRLSRLIEIGAPEVILRNEKRMLQEAVDALIDNNHRPSRAMMNNKKLPYNSLTDELRGKKGIFRRNLLGKRVDYSGRAVIIGDAALTLQQCGLPKSIALEVFKPFVINKLLERELAPNIRVAKDIIELEEDIVWDILQEIIEGRPVLLNRAPTLHKYSIQAFYPKLVEGEAIRIHPLVCKAFNADFDGDAMSVHVLLTDEAIAEAKASMMADKNTVNISNGKLLANPSKDMLLGYYLLTDIKNTDKPKLFGDEFEAFRAYDRGALIVDEEIVVKYKNAVHKTTVGRLIFNQVLPEDYPFVNERVDNGVINRIIEEIRAQYSSEIVVKLLDDLKVLGFKYATDLAFSFAMEDCKVNVDLKERMKGIDEKEKQLQENYMLGLSTHNEKINMSTNMWNDFADELGAEAWKTLDKNNSVYESVMSGANGGAIQARQILTLKGMVRDSRGNWVPLPIKGNFRDGLDAFEYFVAANSGRKGIADRSLRTSSSGYLTRKLVDVAHEVIISQEECGFDGEGIKISVNDDRRLSYEDRIFGRYLTVDVTDSTGKVLAVKGDPITKELAAKIVKAEISEVYVRTPIKCQSPLGICQKCYGFDLEQNELIAMGKAVGVIAAQSIGEPGTQMTMQTFHKGGVQRTDITQGLPRVEELFEARTPKVEAIVSPIDGVVTIFNQEDGSAIVTVKGTQKQNRFYVISDATKINIATDSVVKTGDIMFVDVDGMEKQAPFDGLVKYEGGVLEITGTKEAEEIINVLPGMPLAVNDGDTITTGTPITEGSVDPKTLARLTQDIFVAQKYVLDEVQRVFNEQAVPVDDIHLETILRQMGRLGMVMDSGDSNYLVGSLVNSFMAEVKNSILVSEGKNKSLIARKLMGIKASALYTESFLSAMSFQEQVRVLTNGAILGKIDYLRGMKENVIIGRLIPSGESARVDDVNSLEELKL